MDALRRAYLEILLARAAWRAAKDAEAQVAHWLIEGHAAHSDLITARARTRATHTALKRAQQAYQRAASSTVRQRLEQEA